MQVSLFRIISVGTAAQNKARSSKMLECTPDELFTDLDGELTHDTTSLEQKGVDGDGKPYVSKLKMGVTLECQWLSLGTNRVTPPDVRRGERVFIWQFADQDMYFWTSMGKDNHLRRLETATYVFSATKDDKVKILDSSNCYVIEVSTHDKLLSVTTSKANGEEYAYTVQINAGKGGVVIMDDGGQYFELNSKERKWTITNKDGSIYKMDKDTIYEHAKKSITRKTKDYLLECENQKIVASSSITTTTTKHEATASGGYTMTAPNSSFVGNVNVSGMTSLKGGLAATGGAGVTATISVPMTINAASKFSGDVVTIGAITNNGVSIGSDHRHQETGMGGGITNPPMA